MGTVRVGLVGVGNCACAFLQGLRHYGGNGPGLPGLMHPSVGPYSVSDVEVVAAFDISEAKVGRKLAEAMWAPPNCTTRFADVNSDVPIHRGPTLDGLGRYLPDLIEESHAAPVHVANILKIEQVDVLVNYLPVGSEQAARYYAEAALEAGCAFVNCMPVFLASDPEWAGRFEAAGLPIIGDDIKSQVGATITHRVLAQLFRDRGVKLERTMQLNVGGNSDFYNMLERDRLVSKKVSKTQAITSIAGVEFAPGDIHVGPSDHVPWLTDRKWAYIRLEGTGFGGVPLNLECKLEVWDSPNSAGIVIDAVRCAKLALDRGIAGAVTIPSAAFMKSPPVQVDDDVAFDQLEEFVA